MMKRNILCAIALTGALAITGCASNAAPTAIGEQTVRYGVVNEISPVQLKGDDKPGLGAVVGVLAGGVLGNQVGHGAGRGAATVLGAIGGGFVGNEVEHRYADKRYGQRIIVVLRSGEHIAVTQPADEALRVGDRVRIDGAGEQARVTRD